MENTTVKDKYYVHPSHKMEEWRGTIVTLVSTSRFGEFRSCKKCGAEEAKTVCGHAIHAELNKPCNG